MTRRRTTFPWGSLCLAGFGVLVGMIIGAQCVMVADQQAQEEHCCDQFITCQNALAELLIACGYGRDGQTPLPSERSTD